MKTPKKLLGFYIAEWTAINKRIFHALTQSATTDIIQYLVRTRDDYENSIINLTREINATNPKNTP